MIVAQSVTSTIAIIRPSLAPNGVAAEFAKAPFGDDPLGSVSCGLSQSLPEDRGAMWFSTTPSAGSNTTWLGVTLTTDAPNTQMLASIAVYVNGACVASYAPLRLWSWAWGRG